MGDTRNTQQKRSSHIDNMLNEVQRKIYGQRNETLTPIEINRLFQSPVTPEFNLTIYRALQRNAINPDVTILQAIPRAKTKEYLISIALCLRFGADANMYVDAPKLGTVHILGYVYTVLGGDKFSDDIADNNVLNTIVLMLIAKGSRSSLPMFDRKGGKIRDQTEAPSTSLSVNEWLNDQGYVTILNKINTGDSSQLQQTVDKESLTILSILLDMPTIVGRNYEPQDMVLAIRAFSPISFDKIPIPTTRIMADFKSLDDSVVYLNSDAYQKLLNKGQLPSYVLVNKILIGMRSYRNNDRIIAVQELEKMLLSSISVGTQLDLDQLNIISTMGRDILDAVNKEYDQPYWRKICKSPNFNPNPNPNTSGTTINQRNIPEPLRRLAISLNIDPNMSQSAICENITALSKSDKEALKEASRRRQQLRLAGDLGQMNEFLNGKIPNLVCRNKALLPNDPLDYNDIDIAYYRDDQGAVWCFTSDNFESILESGVNPYNSIMLPNSFKEELQYRINILKRLGINATDIGIYTSKIPITFNTSIDNLTSKDVITEKTSERLLESFIQLAGKNGISPVTIRSLSKDNMINALRSIGYDINISSLSTSHALITTAYIIDIINRTDPDSITPFFNSLNFSQSL
jgi:hypothetical protein